MFHSPSWFSYSPMPSSSPLRNFFFSTIALLFLSVSAHSNQYHHDVDVNAKDSVAGAGDTNLRSKSLFLAKIGRLIVVFFATFVSGLSPYVLKWNEGFLVLGTQFAGGVFLGTAMMHFMSDANGMFEELTEKEYPFAFTLACVGYLITMLSDCVISSVLTKQGSDKSSATHDGVAAGDVEVQGAETGKASGNGVISPPQFQGHSGSNHHLPNPALTSISSLGDTILLIVALCAHSVFEGLAIGVAKTKADAWKTLWTVCLHTIFAAIAMGIALLRMIPNRPLLSCAAYAFAFAFAISSPTDVAIGIIIDATTQGAVADWIFVISMGLACGVFIYVSINHLLSKGYVPYKPTTVDSSYFKFLAVLLGVGVIAVVMIWDT